MPQYTVGGGSGRRVDLPVDFSKAPILGNAGRKINDVLYGQILSPYVTTKDEGALAPGGGLRPTDVFKIRNPRSLAQRLLLMMSEANPSAAELRRNELPNGQLLTDEELAARVRGLPEPFVLPMWRSDP